MPQACFAGLLAMFSYVGSEIVDDPKRGSWVVAFTEWAALVAFSRLQEVDDAFPLSAISPVTIGFIQKIDLSVPISCRDNVDELLFVNICDRKNGLYAFTGDLASSEM